MRKINKIFIHCSATPPSMDIGVKEIDRWHLEKGWSGIGYHEVIRRNGVPEVGRDLEKIGAHVKGHNKDSIGICLIGGIDSTGRAENNFTKQQWRSLERAIRFYRILYPDATVHGHNEYSNKACPSFDVQEWLKSVNL